MTNEELSEGMRVPISGAMRDRIKKLIKRRGNPDVTERDLSIEALSIGLNALEGTLDELDIFRAAARKK